MINDNNRILVVDDEQSIRDMLTAYFNSLSYPNDSASDAEAAVEIINKHENIGMVITDIDLPGMSGIELLRIVREIRPEVPVVMITGLKTLDYAVSAVKHGAQDYITKPFALGDVRKVVEKILRSRISAQKKERIFEYAKSLSLNLEIPSRELDASAIANHLARMILNSGFCNKEEFHQYYVAFMESLINSLEHGNLELVSAVKGSEFDKIIRFEELRAERLQDPRYGNRLVRIAFLMNPQRFSLTISDEGPGFDWRQFTKGSPRSQQLNTKAYGRGFMLIRHIIDEVYFNESGNSITLVKAKAAN